MPTVRDFFENDKIFRRRSATYDLGWIKLRKIKSDGLCFRRTSSKSSLYMSTSFGRAENRSPLVWETRGDCCPKSLKEKQIILYSQHLPKKTFSLIASRKEKNTWNIVKITFSCGNYNIFTFFSRSLPESRNKEHIHGPRTIENGRLFSNYKQNIYVWNLKLQDYRGERKSYLQGVFQLVTFLQDHDF